jgi:hypothetical protein
VGEFGVRVKLSNRVVSFEDDACIVDEDVKMVRERRNKMDCLPNAFRIGDVSEMNVAVAPNVALPCPLSVLKLRAPTKT